MVLVDGGGGYRGDDTLIFHFFHCDNEETHQDVLACFANVGLVVAAACSDGGMTRVVACVGGPAKPDHHPSLKPEKALGLNQ